MPFAPLLALAAVAGATLLTYLYDDDAVFWTRLCVGLCTGLAALGLVGFVIASWLGMTPTALILAGLLTGSPLLLLRKQAWRERVALNLREGLAVARRATVRPWSVESAVLAFYVIAAGFLWQVCDRAVFENVQGIFTGLDTNLGDLPFHIGVISGFTQGENFPPQHPEFAGVPMTYPFVVDFVTAMFMRTGASLQAAFFWQNFTMMLALFGLIHRWALKLTRDHIASLLTPVLVFLSGGFGWWEFLVESARGEGMFHQLWGLQHDYTIGLAGYRWGNAVTALFIPQRGILLGTALSVVVWTLWLKAGGEADRDNVNKNASAQGLNSIAFCLSPFALRPMVAAGLVAGLLPLVHAHSFVVTMAMGGCLSLLQLGLVILSERRMALAGTVASTLQSRLRVLFKPWLAFFLAAAAVGAPQMLWATSGSAVQAVKFLAWEFGWDHGTTNIAWFWLKNTGVFIPLLAIALFWRGRERFVSNRVLFFYLPFTLCFVVPNLFRLAPWVWDNIKVLFYWWLASAPLVALVLARLWRGRLLLRFIAAALLVAQTAAGGLDVWRVASGTVERQTFDRHGLRFAEIIHSSTPPRSLILHAPTYNDPVYLTGRRSFLGYPGHLWSHGLDYTAREEELKRIYSGAPDAADLLKKNGIEYVVVGPLEEAGMKGYGLELNKEFFERYAKVGEEREYRLYKTASP